MKLTVILQQDNRDILNKLQAQQTEDVEIIMYFNKNAQLDEKVVAIKETDPAKTFSKCVKQATGDYIAVITAGDNIEDCYINAILQSIATGKDCYPIKWCFKDWHRFVFVGNVPNNKTMLFSHVYKKELLNEYANIKTNNTQKLGELMIKSSKGDVISPDRVIYNHYR